MLFKRKFEESVIKYNPQDIEYDLASVNGNEEIVYVFEKEIERLEKELSMVSYHLMKGEQLEAILNSTFKQMEDITDVHELTNTQFKRLIQKIEVDKDGNVDIYLRLIGDLGLDETVLIDGTEGVDENAGDNQEKQAKSKENPDAKAISVILEPFSRRLHACSILRLLTKSANPIFIRSLKI